MRRSNSVADLPSIPAKSSRQRSRSYDSRIDLDRDVNPCLLSTLAILPELASKLCLDAFKSSRNVSSKEPLSLTFDGDRNPTVNGHSGRYHELEFLQCLPDDLHYDTFDAHAYDTIAFSECLSKEERDQVNDYSVKATADAFDGSLNVDSLHSWESNDDRMGKKLDRSLRSVVNNELDEEVGNLLLRENYVRERNMSVLSQSHIKDCHFPTKRALLLDVWNDDRASFSRHLEAMSADSHRQKEIMAMNDGKLFAIGKEIDYDRISGSFHIALQLGRFKFLEDFLVYDYPFLSDISKDLVDRWLKDRTTLQYAPFETVIHTDFEDRYKIANLLLHDTPADKLERQREIMHSTIKYKETPLDNIILAGDSDFTRFYLEKVGMTSSAKRLSLLSVVCTGDVNLLNYFWNFECSDGLTLEPDVFYQSAEEYQTGYCAPSAFLTAIDRRDTHMVEAILDICTEAANFPDPFFGVLPHQYAVIRDAPEQLVNLLRKCCKLAVDDMRSPCELLHLMKTALKNRNRDLFDEGFYSIMTYLDLPDFALPEILRYAMFAQFYDVVEHIMELCISYPNLRSNMQRELIDLYIFTLTSENMPDQLFKRMHYCLHRNNINLEVVSEYMRIKEEICLNESVSIC